MQITFRTLATSTRNVKPVNYKEETELATRSGHLPDYPLPVVGEANTVMNNRVMEQKTDEQQRSDKHAHKQPYRRKSRTLTSRV